MTISPAPSAGAPRSTKVLEGKVAIVTGAGRGLGRSHALTLARSGAAVVVNDLGSEKDGRGADSGPASDVVAQILDEGGQAIGDRSDVADWASAERLVGLAVDTFGRLDILVNNAGILRDNMLVDVTEEDWDAVITVNLKGAFAPLRHAAVHWRRESEASGPVNAHVLNTTSHSGLYSNPRQINYATAKAGIASMTVVAARELEPYGVRVNAIAPRAQTRMSEGLREWSAEELLLRDPAYVSALVTYLSSDQAREISGRVFEAFGGGYTVAENWQHGPSGPASQDPTVVHSTVARIHAEALRNAGIDVDTWLNP